MLATYHQSAHSWRSYCQSEPQFRKRHKHLSSPFLIVLGADGSSTLTISLSARQWFPSYCNGCSTHRGWNHRHQYVLSAKLSAWSRREHQLIYDSFTLLFWLWPNTTPGWFIIKQLPQCPPNLQAVSPQPFYMFSSTIFPSADLQDAVCIIHALSYRTKQYKEHLTSMGKLAHSEERKSIPAGETYIFPNCRPPMFPKMPISWSTAEGIHHSMFKKSLPSSVSRIFLASRMLLCTHYALFIIQNALHSTACAVRNSCNKWSASVW